MNKMKFIILLSIVCLFMCSCYSPRYVYNPITQNIPSLHKKNDLEVAAYYGGSLNVFSGRGNYNRGFDIHTAWAVSNHFAATFNESFRWEKNGSNDTFFPGDTSFLSYKRNFTEIGLGYFSSPAYNQKMQFQVFIGAAFGKSCIYDDYISNNVETNKYHESSITKIFTQPAVSFSPSKNFLAALSSRFTAVVFTNIHTNYTPAELDDYILDSLTVSPVFFWEPAFTCTFGFNKFPVKLRVQGSLAVLLNHRFVEHRTGNFGFGLVADFPKRKIKRAFSKN